MVVVVVVLSVVVLSVVVFSVVLSVATVDCVVAPAVVDAVVAEPVAAVLALDEVDTGVSVVLPVVLTSPVGKVVLIISPEGIAVESHVDVISPKNRLPVVVDVDVVVVMTILPE